MSRVAVVAPAPLRVGRVRAKVGTVVRTGQLLVEWRAEAGDGAPAPAPLRAPLPGAVAAILASEGDLLEPGQPALEIEACSHPTVMMDMCAECGADLRSDEAPATNIAVVPMVHSVPELKVSEELAQKIGKMDSDRLLRDRKLVLLVDLDQTLIHTTNDDVPANLKDVRHFRLKSWAPGGYGAGRWYHTRLRPGTLDFLKNASRLFELHICTFGARAYAHQIAELLDPNGELFSHRILSRDECFDVHTKTPNLRALFPCGDNLVCIIDDREDVWNRAANLIQVKPYHFFEHTGDINAPPGLEKTERDTLGQGVHMEDLKFQKQSGDSGDLPSLDLGDSATTEGIKDPPDDGTSPTDTKEDNLPKEGDTRDTENDQGTVEKSETDVVAEAEKSPPNPTKVEDQNRDEDEVFEKIASECETTTSSLERADDDQIRGNKTKWRVTECGMIDIEDSDDYLLFLEEILKRIHAAFYELYDGMEVGSVPDLKLVIPDVKSKVLSGTSLVFSGLVPTHQKLEHSRAYMVARSLGAEVTQDFTERTTHLVAVRPGTAKVHACRRVSNTNGGKSPHTVTPAWLWCCAERWEHVEEKLFPLRGNMRQPRRPPPHCGSPPRASPNPIVAPRRRTSSGRFMDTINPLLSFSSDDIANMDKEVEDMINESDESDSEDKMSSENGNAGEDRLTDSVMGDETQTDILKLDSGQVSSCSEDSIESMSGEFPQGWKPKQQRKRRRSQTPPSSDDEAPDAKEIKEDTTDPTDEETPGDKFKRGEGPPSDAPERNESDSNSSTEAQDELDDGEWNMMGAALEREFLGLDK